MPKRFCGGRIEQAKELLADLARHRPGLRADLEITPDRMKRCAAAVDDLESAIAEILTVPWVPRTIAELTSSIASVRMNIRCVHEQVDECIDDVIERGQLDEYLRLSTAMSMGRVLEFQFSMFNFVRCARKLHEMSLWVWRVCAQRMDKLTLNNDTAQTIGMSHDLKTIVSNNNKATFSSYRDGNFYYIVKVEGKACSFPIPIEDAKGTTFFAEFKAITLMRWIRKALENKTFQPVK